MKNEYQKEIFLAAIGFGIVYTFLSFAGII